MRYYVRSDFLTEVIVEIAIVWHVTPCSLVEFTDVLGQCAGSVCQFEEQVDTASK